MTASPLLFVQRRAGRAGAQTSLARLVAALAPRRRSIVVLDAEGWLAEAVRAAGGEVVIEPFPSSRSLAGRLVLNRRWAERVAGRLAAAGLDPAVVIGNDHLEALLVRRLGARLGRPTGVILRSSGMSGRDFTKYGCDGCDVAFAIGADLAARAAGFPGAARVRPLVDGLAGSDFRDHRPLPLGLPARALVLGTPHPDKGWGDLAAALARLPAGAPVAAMGFDFTQATSASERAALGLGDGDPARFRFLERTTAFAERLADYDLVLHPSRRETFGLAALEALAAGVPVVSSRVGALDEAIVDPRALFAPGAVDDLARVLEALPEAWGEIVAGLPDRRRRLGETHGMDRAVSLFEAGLAAIGPAGLR